MFNAYNCGRERVGISECVCLSKVIMIKCFESVLWELPFDALMQTCMPLYHCLCGYYTLVNASALLPSVSLVSGTCGYHTHTQFTAHHQNSAKATNFQACILCSVSPRSC